MLCNFVAIHNICCIDDCLVGINPREGVGFIAAVRKIRIPVVCLFDCLVGVFVPEKEQVNKK
jgi:hypothetical protein